MDTSIGSFSDFTDSFVGYRVQEQLASIGANTAVGRTPKVSGSLTVTGTQVTAATITADLTALQSDDDRRDGQLARQGIQTSQFPTATFTLTSPIELGTVPADGQEISVTASGTLTLHGVTKDVQIPLTAKLSSDTIVITGSLPIVFADCGRSPPRCACSSRVRAIGRGATLAGRTLRAGYERARRRPSRAYPTWSPISKIVE